MQHKTSTLITAVVLAASVAGSAVHLMHNSGPLVLPDPKLTPGVVDKHATKDKICEKGYAGKVRHVTESDKKAVYAAYGIRSHKPGQYEIDHLISLELGGMNDRENLWPQSYTGTMNAHMKDALENKLHQMVCEGTITLEEAQKDISENWIESYEKYISN